MKAIVFNEIGSPLDVLTLEEVPTPQPGKGEVLVRMAAASINPGDFLFIQKLYPEPIHPEFPNQIAGNHGAGFVEKVGDQVNLKPGTLVAFSYNNTWAEYVVIPVEWIIPLPLDYPLEKAGQFVNLVTAYDLVAKSNVLAGQWLAVTAGNSSISTMVTQFAKAKGINVLSLVRKKNSSPNLLALGAQAIIETTLAKNVGSLVNEITVNQGLHGLIDNVGGLLTGDLIRSMAFGGRVIINGGMSQDTFSLHNFDILMKGLEITSYVYRYFFEPPKDSDAQVLEEIINFSKREDFKVPLGGFHKLHDFQEAVWLTYHQPEKGKDYLYSNPCRIDIVA